MKKILLLFLVVVLATWGSFLVGTAHPMQTSSFTRIVFSPPTVQPTPRSQSPTPVTAVAHATSKPPEVALTFDDGPAPFYTSRVLEILQKYNIHATFFCIGSQVQTFPYLVQQEAFAGNTVGNHTWSHPDLTTLSPAEVTAQLKQTSDAIEQTTGVRPTVFRPPYGAVNPLVTTLAARQGLSTVLWTVDPSDWQRPGVNVIVSRVLNNIANGSIILMHDGGGNRSQTIQALPIIITSLLRRGFVFVTIPHLFAQPQQPKRPLTNPIPATPNEAFSNKKSVGNLHITQVFPRQRADD